MPVFEGKKFGKDATNVIFNHLFYNYYLLNIYFMLTFFLEKLI